jgi:hypothetical protein
VQWAIFELVGWPTTDFGADFVIASLQLQRPNKKKAQRGGWAKSTVVEEEGSRAFPLLKNKCKCLK